MVEGFYSFFRRTGNNCNYCFLSDEYGDAEKKITLQNPC